MNTRSYKDPFPGRIHEVKRHEPIEGYQDGLDYAIACRMAEIYAAEHGWSHTRRYPKSTTYVRFDYEFYMSRNGERDSKDPKHQIKVGYAGGGKCVEIFRNGSWTAVYGLNDDGSAGHGQWQGESGIDDLITLRELHRRVLSETSVA